MGPWHAGCTSHVHERMLNVTVARFRGYTAGRFGAVTTVRSVRQLVGALVLAAVLASACSDDRAGYSSGPSTGPDEGKGDAESVASPAAEAGPPSRLGEALTTVLEDREGTYGVVVEHVPTGERFERNQGRTFPSGSVYKLAVAYEVLRRAEAHQLDLDEPLAIEPAVSSMKTSTRATRGTSAATSAARSTACLALEANDALKGSRRPTRRGRPLRRRLLGPVLQAHGDQISSRTLVPSALRAIFSRSGWPPISDLANLTACSPVILAGMGASSGSTTASTTTGPAVLRA
jgi:hypothetical protein